MADFTEGLDEPEVVEGELIPFPGTHLAKRDKQDAIRDIAREIADDAARVNKDILSFADIDPEATAPPEEWVRLLGKEAADRRFRTAKYALMSSGEAPVALKIASQLGATIMKAKASERNIEQNINIERFYMTAPVPEYPELELESE